jgi:hypothetical protein
MKFLSTRELRNRPGYVRKLAQKDDLVLTRNGKPIAILLGVEEDQLEERAGAIRHAKAQLALSSSAQASSRPRRRSHVGLRDWRGNSCRSLPTQVSMRVVIDTKCVGLGSPESSRPAGAHR